MHDNNIKTTIAFMQSMNLPSIETRLHTLPLPGETFIVRGVRYEVHRRELQLHELMEGSKSCGFQQRCLLVLK